MALVWVYCRWLHGHGDGRSCWWARTVHSWKKMNTAAITFLSRKAKKKHKKKKMKQNIESRGEVNYFIYFQPFFLSFSPFALHLLPPSLSLSGSRGHWARTAQRNRWGAHYCKTYWLGSRRAPRWSWRWWNDAMLKGIYPLTFTLTFYWLLCLSIINTHFS